MKTKDHFRCHQGLQVSPTSRTVEQGLPVRPRQLELYGPSWNECMHDDDKLNQTAIGTLEEQELGHTHARMQACTSMKPYVCMHVGDSEQGPKTSKQSTFVLDHYPLELFRKRSHYITHWKLDG